MEFKKTESRLIDGGLIAISIIILPVWVAIGLSDPASWISLMALGVSLPLLVTDLFLSNMPNIRYSSRKALYLARIIRWAGWIGAFFGIVAAISHLSRPVAFVFGIISVLCFFTYTHIWDDTKHSLE